MRTLKLTLAYDGGDFIGWQRQPIGQSIQGELERAFEEIEGQRIDVYGAEAGATFSVNDQMSVVTNVSVIDKNQFEATRAGQDPEMIPLNAPTLKMNAAMTYRNDDDGYHGGLRFRVQNGFKAESGVYVGKVDGFGVLDLSGGFRIPGFDDLWFQADVQNVFNN